MLKALFVPMALAGVFAMGAVAAAEDKAEVGPVLDNTLKSIEGKDVDLSKYKGKVLLIVNVASKCGATPQYKELEALHEKYGKDGLAVLGVPCNQFGGQEPGSEKEIAEFCSKTYDVKFDLFSKVDVNGDQQAPLYKYLTSEAGFAKDAGPVKWNFEKFLVGKDGKVVARYRTGVKPSSPVVVNTIEAELKK